MMDNGTDWLYSIDAPWRVDFSDIRNINLSLDNEAQPNYVHKFFITNHDNHEIMAAQENVAPLQAIHPNKDNIPTTSKRNVNKSMNTNNYPVKKLRTSSSAATVAEKENQMLANDTKYSLKPVLPTAALTKPRKLNDGSNIKAAENIGSEAGSKLSSRRAASARKPPIPKFNPVNRRNSHLNNNNNDCNSNSTNQVPISAPVLAVPPPLPSASIVVASSPLHSVESSEFSIRSRLVPAKLRFTAATASSAIRANHNLFNKNKRTATQQANASSAVFTPEMNNHAALVSPPPTKRRMIGENSDSCMKLSIASSIAPVYASPQLVSLLGLNKLRSSHKRDSYVDRHNSVDINRWQAATGQNWWKMNEAERQVANQQITGWLRNH
jgi:hypothetical protein